MNAISGFLSRRRNSKGGGALSRFLADLVIENKIEAPIRAHERWGKIWDWARLIDDTLSGWESKEIFNEFFDYLNTIHSNIIWTCEIEEEGKLPIFDILIMRTDNGFETTVYRKGSHSNRYIHYTSAQAWKEKVASIKSLKKRAIEYCSNEQLLADEFSLLIDVFEQNGYPRKITHRILHEKDRAPKSSDLNLDQSFYVPYHHKGKRLYKIIEEQFGCTVIYMKTKTIGDLLKKKMKTKESKYKQNVVYTVPCKECPTQYVGQTKKSVATRTAQHEAMCKKKTKLNLIKLKTSKKDNGLAYHHIKTKHEFDFDNTQIIAEEPNYWRRLIKEGIEIQRRQPNANLKAGFEIDKCWDPFLKLHPKEDPP